MKSESESEIHKREIDNIFNQSVTMHPVEDWLQTYSSAKQDKHHNLLMFCEWFGKSPKQLLTLRRKDENRGMEKLCIKYLHFLVEAKKLQVNTAINKVGTIRSFFNFHDVPLRFKRNELPKPRPKPYKFSLTIDHLRFMWNYMNVWLRAMSILAVENGLRISDVQNLTRSDIENLLSQQPPANMEIQTLKTGVLARIHLSKEAMETIKVYLQTVPDSQTRLFVKDEDTINKALQKVFKQAYPNLDYKPTFHDYRRLFLSTGSNCGINQWHLKMMCGKTIDPSILTYLRNLDLKADFTKIKSQLTIHLDKFTPETKEEISYLHKRIEQLEFITAKQQEVIAQFQLKLDSVLQHLAKKKQYEKPLR